MKLPFKKKKEVVFKTVETQQGFTLRNQERELTDFRVPGHPAVYQAAATVGCQYSAENLDCGAFPRSVGADIAHHLSVRNGKAHISEGMNLLILPVKQSLYGFVKACVPLCNPVRLAHVFHRNHHCFLLVVMSAHLSK